MALANAAAATQNAPAAPVPPTLAQTFGPSVMTVDGPKGPTRIITYPDGKGGMGTLTIGPNGVVQNTQVGVGRASRDIPPGVAALLNDGMVAVVMIVVTLSVARIIGRMMDRRSAAPRADTDTSQRLQAIENAVESIAVEVERISEGQRFTARVLTERAHQPAAEFVGNSVREKSERANG